MDEETKNIVDVKLDIDENSHRATISYYFNNMLFYAVMVVDYKNILEDDENIYKFSYYLMLTDQYRWLHPEICSYVISRYKKFNLFSKENICQTEIAAKI